eukprot:6674139-Pyramimonas_sp.AAC.1
MQFASRNALTEHLAKGAPKCVVALLANGQGCSGDPEEASRKQDLISALYAEAVARAAINRSQGLGRWRSACPARKSTPSRPPTEFGQNVIALISDAEARAALVEADSVFFGGSRGK